MAVEIQKVVAALELKYKGKLTKNFIGNLAKKWADKIDDDAGIDAYINDRDDLILEAHAEADRRAQQATIKAKNDAATAITGKPDPEKQDEPAAPALPADTPEWMKSFIQMQQKQMDALTQTVTGLQQARTAETLTDRFKKDERLKGIPEFMLKGRIPEKEEDFEPAITELVADFKPYAEKLKVGGFGSDTPAAGSGGAGGKGDKKEATKEELDAVMNNL